MRTRISSKTDNSRDGRMGVHALFIDFRKTFDLVDHGILLRMLAEMNVSKCFWLWTRSFLEGRSQQINLGGALSSIMPWPLGVPQRSVLSPTLFNVHVNDFEDSIGKGARNRSQRESLRPVYSHQHIYRC